MGLAKKENPLGWKCPKAPAGRPWRLLGWDGAMGREVRSSHRVWFSDQKVKDSAPGKLSMCHSSGLNSPVVFTIWTPSLSTVDYSISSVVKLERSLHQCLTKNILAVKAISQMKSCFYARTSLRQCGDLNKDCPPTGSCTWTLSLQLAVLFGEDTEPLGIYVGAEKTNSSPPNTWTASALHTGTRPSPKHSLFLKDALD